MVEALDARAMLSPLGLARTLSARINAFSTVGEELYAATPVTFPKESLKKGTRFGSRGSNWGLQGQAYNH